MPRAFASRDRRRHLALVDLVRARKRNAHDDRRQAGGVELRVQQLLAHAMHADARESVGDRGERADDVEFAGAAHLVQRPGAVLAARPGDQRFRRASIVIAARACGARRASRPARRRAACSPLLQHAIAQRRVGRALAGFPGAADRAPQRLVQRPRRRTRRGRAPAPSAPCAPRLAGRRRRDGAEHLTARAFQRVAWLRLIAFFTSVPNSPASQSRGEVDHRRLALAPTDRGRTRRRPRPLQSGVPDDVGEQRRGARARRLARTPDRRAAGRADCPAARARCGRSCRAQSLRRGVELALRQRPAMNLILSPTQHVGRGRDDHGARDAAALRGLELDALASQCDRASPASTAAPAGRRRASPAARRSPGGRTHRAFALAGARRDPCAEISSRSLPQPKGPSTNSTRRLPVAEIVRQRLRAGTSALPRAASRDGAAARAPCAARKSSSSPSRALRRPMRMLLPARRRIDLEAGRGASLARSGLMSGLWSQCAPRSNGTPKVAVSVTQRPPMRSDASTSTKRRPAAASRRAAAMPAAPAPTIDHVDLARRRRGAAQSRRRAAQRGGGGEETSGGSMRGMVSEWFPADGRDIARTRVRAAITHG